MRYFITAMAIALSLALTATAVTAGGTDPKAESSQQARSEQALSKLKAEPGSVALYAQGLCCQSCAIGIRKKVASLDFVDKVRFNDGVELDAEHQLVTIAIKKGKRFDAPALTKAIDTAGYKPVHLYTLKDNKLSIETL